MLDVINLPDDTTIECDLREIPQELAERVNLHLLHDEAPFLCMMTKFFNGVAVYALTSYRAVKVKAMINKKKLDFREYDAGSSSLIFPDFRGLTHDEHGANPINYDLHFLGHSGNIEFQFKDKNLFFKFAGAIVDCANQK
jgi:hypothetical protein